MPPSVARATTWGVTGGTADGRGRGGAGGDDDEGDDDEGDGDEWDGVTGAGPPAVSTSSPSACRTAYPMATQVSAPHTSAVASHSATQPMRRPTAWPLIPGTVTPTAGPPYAGHRGVRGDH